jgi:hypothetical protein
MNKLICIGLSVGLAVAASAGTDMRSGRPAGKPPPLPEAVVPVTPCETSSAITPKPDDEPVTPLAVTLLGFGVPYTTGWDIYGLRLNTCIPGWSVGHDDVFGIDVGFSGEMSGDVAGISCNVFDNICSDFGGIQIGGLYNRIRGDSPAAIQLSFVHNRVNAMNGIQIGGIWNVATRFRGLQIGIVNYAEEGAGLQIGLWNQCGTIASPILGVVF